MSLTAVQRRSPPVHFQKHPSLQSERDATEERTTRAIGELIISCAVGSFLVSPFPLPLPPRRVVGVALLHRRSLKFVLTDVAERSCTRLLRVELIPQKRLDESDLTRSKHEVE